MAYYPKSQIQTNLHTNGGEYLLSSTRKVYSGYYYKLSNGEAYSGKSPSDTPNELLIEARGIENNTNQFPYTSDYDIVQSVGERINIINSFYEMERGKFNPPINSFYYYSPNSTSVPLGRSIPRTFLTIPTQKDYDLGEFQLYFAKKRNQNFYLEISKETHDQLKNSDPKIAWDLYTTISLPWDLSGEQTQTYTTNKNIVILVEEKNKWYGFTQWFKDDFLKYYKSLDIEEDLFTDGTEFINRRTKLAYRGPYHIHPEKGPMVGAKHIQRKHDYLDPIQLAQDLIVDPTPTSTPTYSGGGGGSTSGGGGGYSGGGGGY